MVATSEGDVFDLHSFPEALFTRAYRDRTFVVYNLKYDSGALLQRLPRKALNELRESQECEWNGYKFKTIGYKCLTIRRGKHAIHIYDMYGFFLTSLEKAAQTFLGRGKLDIETKTFTRTYVRQNWDRISNYCVQDAALVRDLALKLITYFEDFGVFPQKLYSTAYVSWTYFRTHCPYIHVKRYWDHDRDVLRFAVAAYNGGKFEVTRKGRGSFYEYDIVSAYPYEISNLVDIRKARVVRDARYRARAAYSLYDITTNLPFNLNSPVVVKSRNLCTFPVGIINRVVTKGEYEYLIAHGADVKINKAVHLIVENPTFPYREEILKLMEQKNRYKRESDVMRYHTVKIFLNSLYGKMAQLIEDRGKLKAGAAWNPIYAGEVTARCRLRVTEMQQKYKSIVAVHTDSIISTQPLDIEMGSELGEWEFSKSGEGVILGTGIYQIGEKSRFRGYPTKKPLLELMPKQGKTMSANRIAAISWRETVFRNESLRMINRFVSVDKHIRVDFDTKRLWLDDWRDYSDVGKRVVESLPLVLVDLRESSFPY